MTNHPTDPPKGSAQDLALRKAFYASELRRAQREREWDARLAERDRRLSQTSVAAELEAKLAELKQQMADTLAELDDEPDEPPAQPPPPGQRSMEQEAIFTSAEEAAAAAGPFSAEFAAWRRQHVPSARGLF